MLLIFATVFGYLLLNNLGNDLGNYSLDKVARRLLREAKYYDISSLRRREVVGKAIHDEVIIILEGVLH